MRNFQDTVETPKPLFISAFLICMTVPLITVLSLRKKHQNLFPKIAVLKILTKCLENTIEGHHVRLSLRPTRIINFLSETSKCCEFVFSSYFVKCLFPLDSGRKSNIPFLKVFDIFSGCKKWSIGWKLVKSESGGRLITLPFLEKVENLEESWSLHNIMSKQRSLPARRSLREKYIFTESLKGHIMKKLVEVKQLEGFKNSKIPSKEYWENLRSFSSNYNIGDKRQT